VPGGSALGVLQPLNDQRYSASCSATLTQFLLVASIEGQHKELTTLLACLAG